MLRLDETVDNSQQTDNYDGICSDVDFVHYDEVADIWKAIEVKSLKEDSGQKPTGY